MKIVLGSDHGGYEYKEELKKFLETHDYEVIDVGTDSEESCSWSEYGLKAAEKVASGEADYGVVICKSGQGVCIAANKVKGVYCGIAYNDKNAVLCKEHDGCNVIAFGSEYTTIDEVKKRTYLFLKAEFKGGRHLDRLNYLKDFENK